MKKKEKSDIIRKGKEMKNEKEMKLSLKKLNTNK